MASKKFHASEMTQAIFHSSSALKAFLIYEFYCIYMLSLDIYRKVFSEMPDTAF